MTSSSDSKVTAWQREFEDLGREQTNIHREIEELRQDEEQEIAKIKSRFDQKRVQLQRKYDAAVSKAESVRRQIERRTEELSAVEAKKEKAPAAANIKKGFSF